MFFAPTTKAQTRAQTRAQNRVVTVPAPVGGLNARDSIAMMPETDALIMRNLWPQPYGCLVKKGSKEFAIGMSGDVTTLASWASLTSSPKLFAWNGASMYDITAGGTVGTALITGLSNARWETTAMSNSAGSHLVCVNGVDNGILYNAASGAVRLTAGDGIAANTWNGISPANAVQVTVHQGRLWAVEKNTSKAWYLPVGQITGIFTSFDFGSLFSRGGSLQYVATWTIDTGGGAFDHLVAVSSEGEAVVYAGTNPSSSTTWGLAGAYYVGAPIAGRRSYTKVAGDLNIITQRGVISMSALLISTKVKDQEMILKSSKIAYLISAATSASATLNGWQLLYVPPYNMLLLNVPTDPALTADGNFQYAANELVPQTPWTQFVDWPASCFVVWNNKLYYGDANGRVLEAWTGSQENVKLPIQISTNSTFDTTVLGWTPSAFNTLAWQSPNYARLTQTATGRGYLRQTPTGDYTNVSLQITATYRNISTVAGAYVVVYDAVSGLVQATLPVSTSTSFVTNSATFLCTAASIRIEGRTVSATEAVGRQIEFDSLSLAIAQVGTGVQFVCQQAYSYMGALSVQKQLGMYRPSFTAAQTITYTSNITYDFAVSDLTIPNAGAPASIGFWGSGRWGVSVWSGSTVNRNWVQAQGIGVAASIVIAGQTVGETTWIATDYSYKVGGIL